MQPARPHVGATASGQDLGTIRFLVAARLARQRKIIALNGQIIGWSMAGEALSLVWLLNDIAIALPMMGEAGGNKKSNRTR